MDITKLLHKVLQSALEQRNNNPTSPDWKTAWVLPLGHCVQVGVTTLYGQSYVWDIYSGDVHPIDVTEQE